MPMKLKTVDVDGKTYALVQDGKPVYEADDGKEIVHDAEHAVSTISRLNRESQGHREEKERLAGDLKRFEGIEDPDAARKALETVGNLDQSKLLAADKVDEIKRGVEQAVEAKYTNQIKALEGQVNTLTGERDGFKTSLDREVIGGNFARSKFISDKLILPSDIAEATFGKHFKVEDGKLMAYDANGGKVFSRERYGEPASFDEAMEQLVDAYPNKASILKGSGHSGADTKHPNGGGDGKSMSRTEFFKLSPADQMAKVREGVTVTE